MSSSMPMYEWLVHIPDHPNSLQKRMAVRPQHLADLRPDVESGKATFGGGTLVRQPASGEDLALNGSVMLVYAANEEDVRKRILEDVYAKTEVWDVSKLQIWPFKCAIRTAM